MGFYLRRSVRVGPFRFNLSTGGVGMSVGVRGFRVGTGPRGNYVHMGRGGLYFRSGLPSGSPTQEPAMLPRGGGSPGSSDAPPLDSTLAAFKEIDSATPVQLSDSSSVELVQQIAAKIHVVSLMPMILVIGIAITGFLGYLFVNGVVVLWPAAIAAALTIILSVIARRRDVVAKAVVLMYELEDVAQEAYTSLHTAFEGLASAGGLWHVNSEAAVLDRKYHAGASGVVNRDPIAIRKGEPPVLKTNVETVLLPAGRQLLAFMPDRLLVFDGGAVGGIGYDNLKVEVGESQFIENGSPPQDAKVVGYTWRYVNKKGGPDRRFANNPQLSIALYETVHFRSPSGLNELFQCSRLGTGKAVQQAVAAIAKVATEISSNSHVGVKELT